MASQHPSNAGQNQMMRDNMLNQPSDIHSQGQAQDPSFLQETGSQIGNIAHGATEMGKGFALGAASLARGGAQGASNVAQGAADAIKNTFGLGSTASTDGAAATNHPSSNTNMSGSTDPSSININMDGSGYPNKPSFPHVP